MRLPRVKTKRAKRLIPSMAWTAAEAKAAARAGADGEGASAAAGASGAVHGGVRDLPGGEPPALAVLLRVRDAAGDGLSGLRLPAAAGRGALLPPLRDRAGDGGRRGLGAAHAVAEGEDEEGEEADAEHRLDSGEEATARILKGFFDHLKEGE